MFGMKKWSGSLLDDATTEVVVHGTSFRQAALRKSTGIQVFKLDAETTNSHDRNAVMVKLGTQLVGYLPKEIARPFSQLIQQRTALKTWTFARGEVRQYADGDNWVMLQLPATEVIKAALPSTGP